MIYFPHRHENLHVRLADFTPIEEEKKNVHSFIAHRIGNDKHDIRRRKHEIDLYTLSQWYSIARKKKKKRKTFCQLVTSYAIDISIFLACSPSWSAILRASACQTHRECKFENWTTTYHHSTVAVVLFFYIYLFVLSLSRQRKLYVYLHVGVSRYAITRRAFKRKYRHRWTNSFAFMQI